MDRSRRRDVEARIGDPAQDATGAQVRSERDLRHHVQLVLDDVQRPTLEQDAVAVRHALATREHDLPCHACWGDREELAGARLDDDEPRPVRSCRDPVHVEVAGTVRVVARQLNRRHC